MGYLLRTNLVVILASLVVKMGHLVVIIATLVVKIATLVVIVKLWYIRQPFLLHYATFL